MVNGSQNHRGSKHSKDPEWNLDWRDISDVKGQKAAGRYGGPGVYAWVSVNEVDEQWDWKLLH